jgi:hypothetical protein
MAVSLAASMTAPPPTLPDVRHQLGQARDEHLAQVVALVDALPQRGAADALIAPLRPRLALLAPMRPVTAMRLMFSPLDPVIVPGPGWRPGLPAVPRLALGCLGAAVMARIGPVAEAVQGMIAGMSPQAATAAGARVGVTLWPAAAAVLDALPVPPDWTETAGLPLGCYDAIRANVAAVLHQAVRLERLAMVDPGPCIGAILADAQTRNPATVAIVLAVLLSHGAAATVLTKGAGSAGAVPGGLAALPSAVLDAAAVHALDRADRLLDTVLPAVGLRAAAGHAGDVAALVDAVETPACRPGLRAQAGRTRQAADQACQARLSQAVQHEMLPKLDGPPLDDTAMEGLEGVARDLRRLGRAGRRLGSPAAYDALLKRAAQEIGAAPGAGLGRMDRLRLAELLVGAPAAMRLVPEGDAP